MIKTLIDDEIFLKVFLSGMKLVRRDSFPIKEINFGLLYSINLSYQRERKKKDYL